MNSEDADSNEQSFPEGDAPKHNTTTRFGRFAKLSSMTAGVAARTLGQKVASAFQSDEEAEAARRRSRERSASSIAATFGELKGAAMKIGQMLSTDPELLPPEFADAFATLQKDAPPMDFSMVQGVVENALGGGLSDHFRSFSTAPIGAASIGQVHRATTLEGQDVAVKVQYPGIADSIESDLKNLGSMLNLARAKLPRDRVDAYLEEVRAVIVRESDYLLEADTLERFQTILKHVPGVRVPTPVFELTRTNLLTMEFIEGQRLSDWLAGQSDEKKTSAGCRIIEAYIEMVHTHGALHADPHPGNFLVDADENIVFLDLGCVRDYDLAFSDGLIQILVGLWQADLPTMQEAWQRLGFQDRGIDPEVIYEWLELMLKPLTTDTRFDFAEWKVHESSMQFIKRNPSILNFSPPREVIFYLRVLAGLRGLLGSSGVRINAYRMSRDAVRARGLM